MQLLLLLFIFALIRRVMRPVRNPRNTTPEATLGGFTTRKSVSFTGHLF